MDARVEYAGHRSSPSASITSQRPTSHCLASWWTALKSFAKAFYYGAWLCLTYREFIWLIPSKSAGLTVTLKAWLTLQTGYTFALYGHRYLEFGILQMYAKTILGRSSLVQIMVGG